MKSKEFYRKVNEYIKEIKKEEIVDLVNNILRKIPESKFEERIREDLEKKNIKILV